ncbi:DNA repair protein XRCC4 [Herrania umbratica]|uniref:DNA repair protein XRCC4 n=1 Tax=Herrania umbratica TaxID=108875 RepID=A0A6J1AXR2_9ROSI|nr:DNA repair protein XRCC4 [Herrania umbratica]
METSSSPTTRHTFLKIEIPSTEPIFVKGTWFDTHFDISITDGLHAWVCNATEEEVKERAAQWDQPVTEYIELAERYLGFQQPGSVYRFADAGDDQKRLSWTFEKEGTKLEWRWKFRPSPDSRKITGGILDFLMDANIRLSEEVVRKTQSFEKLKVEAEKCLEQSERSTNEKMEFESEIYAKFLGVLNSKKAKLRELRDQLSKQETTGKALMEEEDSTDKTESYRTGSDAEESEEEPEKNLTSTSKDVLAAAGRGRGRKRAMCK